MTDPIQEFIIESLENLDRFDAQLLVLEENPSEKKTIAAIFRTLHTIKGTCGFLALSKLERLAHAGESLLALVRDGHLPFSPNIASALLSTGDAIRRILAELEESKTEGNFDHSQLIETLIRLQKPEKTGTFSASESVLSPEPKPAESDAPSKASAPRLTHESEEKPISENFRSSGSSIRVQIETLDTLMNLVGELVLTRNQITQIASESSDPELQGAIHRLSQITAGIQEGMMKTRVQPIETIWSKFPRTLRDLAEITGKKVKLLTEGSETELDRTVLESIKEPLVHLLRNSVDHGIESPEKRKALGKPEEGSILLRAFHAAGLVTLEISDDGGGIQPERIKAKALEKKLILPEAADRMSTKDLIQLILLPGFSTAESVSTLSGRGVGMDVVKTEIEKIGGILEIESETGRGSTFRIKIPLTLAILPAVIVGCCGRRFVIPQANLVEVLALEGALKVQSIQEALVVRLRGSFLPVVRLRSALQLNRQDSFPTRHLAVLRAGSRQFGLVVDSIESVQEIVVKPLHRCLMGLSCFAGSTILGDGQVALILDVLGIGTRANVLSSSEQLLNDSALEASETEIPPTISAQTQTGEDRSQLLIFRVGGTRAAIPLRMVHRLEEFPADQVEPCAGRQVVQYEGEILPLLPVAQAIGLPETFSDPTLVQAVIYSHANHSIGLVIEALEFIAEEKIDLKTAGKRPGVLGSAVIRDRVTEIIDIPSILRTHAPEFFHSKS